MLGENLVLPDTITQVCTCRERGTRGLGSVTTAVRRVFHGMRSVSAAGEPRVITWRLLPGAMTRPHRFQVMCEPASGWMRRQRIFGQRLR